MPDKFIYPTAAVNYVDEQKAANSSEESLKSKYPYPCCTCITLPVPPEEAIAYICPVCFWENDVFAVIPVSKCDSSKTDGLRRLCGNEKFSSKKRSYDLTKSLFDSSLYYSVFGIR